MRRKDVRVRTVVYRYGNETYIWDRFKDRANRAKHSVGFREAVTVFHDPLHGTVEDEDHSTEENRYATIGRSDGGRLLFVVHADYGHAVRMISARRATPIERHGYEEGKK